MRMAGKDQRIQALRGLAAMLVVILHAHTTLDSLKRPHFVTARLIPDNGFGAFGVDLFFIISGVVMGMVLERDESPRAFVRARFVRVVPMFWLAAIATIVLSLAVGRPLTIESLANSITILPFFDLGVINPPVPAVGWTLAFELYFYLIVALALGLPRRLRFEAVLAVLTLCAFIGELIQPVLVPILGITCNAMLLEFAVGLIALRVAQHRIVARYASLMIAAGIGALLYSAVIGVGISGAPQATVAGQTSAARLLVWGCPSALLIAGLIGRPDRMRSNSFLARLGDASYSIYLVHTSVMMAVSLAWPSMAPLGNDLLFVILIATSALAGLAAHRWVEKAMLARLREKKPPLRISAAKPAGEEAGEKASLAHAAAPASI